MLTQESKAPETATATTSALSRDVSDAPAGSPGPTTPRTPRRSLAAAGDPLGRTLAAAVLRRAATIQRMPYVNADVDRGPTTYALRVANATTAEIDQLIDPGGIGATTVRELGPANVIALARRTSVAQTIALILHLTKPQINRLTALEQEYGSPAPILGYFLSRPPADIAAMLAPPADNRDLSDIVMLAHALVPAGATAADVHALASLPPAVGIADLLATLTLLNGITLAQKTELVGALAYDGMSGTRIRTLLTTLTTAGQTPVQIHALIGGLRGNLQQPVAQDPAARSVTDVPAVATMPVAAPVLAPLIGAGGILIPPLAPGGHAPAPVLPAAQQAGTKGLSGPQIEAHLAATTAAGRGVATIATTYPTGQDFSPAQRTDLELWDDLKINAAGATLLPNVTPGQPQETPAQREIRQRLALRELMRRHPGRAGVIQSIFSHDEGATPRPFVSIAQEDTYNANAHNVSRHVLGGSNMRNIESLAWRVITKVPQCGAVATAFTSVPEADLAVAAALATANFFTPVYWQTFRDNLAQGVLQPQIVAPNNLGVALRKTDPPAGQPYPTPLAPVLAARDLISVPGNPPGLTHQVPVTGIVVRLQPSDNAAGRGWCVYTTYPQP